MKLKPGRVGRERAARQPGPLHRVLAFLDPLLAGAALIVEADDPLGGAGQVGDDEADAGITLAGVPLDFCYDAARCLPALRPVAEVGVETPDFVRWATDRSFQQMDDAILKNLIGREPDRILVSSGFEELVNLGVCESCIGAEVVAHLARPVTRDHRFQDVTPAIGGVDVTRTQTRSVPDRRTD